MALDPNTHDDFKKDQAAFTDNPFFLETEKSGEPVYDPEALERLREILGDQVGELIPELIADFDKNADKLMVDIEKAIKSRDSRLLRLSAHSLKSNGANLGTMELAWHAQIFEIMGKNGEFRNIEAKLPDLEKALTAAKIALVDLQKREFGVE